MRRVAPRRAFSLAGDLTGVQVHCAVPDQATAGRRTRWIGRRRRILRAIDNPLPLAGRVGPVGRVQERGDELDRQHAREDQADDGEEDADTGVHEGHSLVVGREIDGGEAGFYGKARRLINPK